MSKSSSVAGGIDDSYSITKQGLRFRLKKRTYNEMMEDKSKQNAIDAPRNNNNNTINNSRNNNSEEYDDNSDENEEEYPPKHKIKHKHIPKNNNIASDNTIANAINYNNNNSNLHLKASIMPTLPTQSNNILFKEAERFKSTLATFALNFKTEKMPKLVTIIANVCSKLIKKKTISCEVLNFYKHIDFNLPKSYSSEASPINLELALFDCLLDKNDFYNNILISESNVKIANLLLYYLSQMNITNIGNTLSPFIEYSIDQFKQKRNVTFKNSDNIMNIVKDSYSNNIFHLLKASKAKLPIQELQSKLSQVYFNNLFTKIINELFKTKKHQLLDSVFLFDFDSLSYIFQTNPSFLPNQLTALSAFPKLIQNAHDNVIKYRSRCLNTHLIKKINKVIQSKQASQIMSFEVYYINTTELISDYLDD